MPLKISIFVFFLATLGYLRISTIVRIIKGMLIRNTHSQEAKCVITPPHKGPITPPASALAPISPKTIGELNFGTIFAKIP